MVALKTAPVPPADYTARLAASRESARLDAALVQRFNAGDESAFVQIVSRYRTKMQQVAMGLLRNRADAEEIAQDTFIRAHRGLARFRGDSSLAAWLYRITINLSRNRYWYYFRRRRQGSVPLDAAISEGCNTSFADIVASDAPSPVHEAVTSEFAAIIAGCMNQLPASQREILTLRNVQLHSYADISRRLGIRIGTAKSRIARARTTLRGLLRKSYPESPAHVSPFLCFEPIRSSGQVRIACA